MTSGLSHQRAEIGVNALFDFGLLLLVPLIYLGLSLVGLLFGGAGHGTLVFAELPSWPVRGSALGLFWPVVIVWGTMAFLLALRSFVLCRIGALVLLAAHHLTWFWAIEIFDPYYIRKTWKSLESAVSLWLLVYGAIQVVVLVLLIRSFFRKPSGIAHQASIV